MNNFGLKSHQTPWFFARPDQRSHPKTLPIQQRTTTGETNYERILSTIHSRMASLTTTSSLHSAWSQLFAIATVIMNRGSEREKAFGNDCLIFCLMKIEQACSESTQSEEEVAVIHNILLYYRQMLIDKISEISQQNGREDRLVREFSRAIDKKKEIWAAQNENSEEDPENGSDTEIATDDEEVYESASEIVNWEIDTEGSPGAPDGNENSDSETESEPDSENEENRENETENTASNRTENRQPTVFELLEIEGAKEAYEALKNRQEAMYDAWKILSSSGSLTPLETRARIAQALKPLATIGAEWKKGKETYHRNLSAEDEEKIYSKWLEPSVRNWMEAFGRGEKNDFLNFKISQDKKDLLSICDQIMHRDRNEGAPFYVPESEAELLALSLTACENLAAWCDDNTFWVDEWDRTNRDLTAAIMGNLTIQDLVFCLKWQYARARLFNISFYQPNFPKIRNFFHFLDYIYRCCENFEEFNDNLDRTAVQNLVLETSETLLHGLKPQTTGQLQALLEDLLPKNLLEKYRETAFHQEWFKRLPDQVIDLKYTVEEFELKRKLEQQDQKIEDEKMDLQPKSKKTRQS